MHSATPRFRFAPSPTGALHIGGARTALYNWLAARGSAGSLVLRIEDTDLERSTPENVAQILEALRWLELDFDGEPVSQAARRDRHRAALDQLIETGAAYPDPASGEEVKAWKAAHGGAAYRGEAMEQDGAAIRLRVPDDGDTVVEDLIRGPVSFPNAALDDFVIARGDGTPLYNLAVAVDDLEMGVTDVVRGDDHLSNTPKQLLVIRALGAEPPRYAHLPLLHGPDGKKLSKRHGAASVQELRDVGYLPAALRNYLALLGWGAEDDTTIMSTDELVERFSVARVGRAAAIFDEQKLRWLNGRHLRALDPAEYEARLGAFLEATDPEASGRFRAGSQERRRGGCEIVTEKAQTLGEAWRLIAFLFGAVSYDEKAWRKVMREGAREALGAARDALRSLEAWDAATIEDALAPLPDALGLKPGAVYQPVRVAVTGGSVSPGIFATLAVLGRDDSLERIDAALRRFDPPSPGSAHS
jgi:glutamyl-tRNA synthetase